MASELQIPMGGRARWDLQSQGNKYEDLQSDAGGFATIENHSIEKRFASSVCFGDCKSPVLMASELQIPMGGLLQNVSGIANPLYLAGAELQIPHGGKKCSMR